MKNILIDIKHPAQLNLFKNISKKLQENGWNVIICYLNRGKLPRIIEKEYSGFRCISIGQSRGTKWSIFWEGNVIRTNDFLKLIKKEKINICVAASSAPLALAGKLTGTPVIQFYDDPERKGINRVNEILSTKLFFPPIVEPSHKIGIFNCLKEWSYLSPGYFSPNQSVLEQYHVKAKEYVFVREVSNKSFNYYDQEDAIVCSMAHEISPDVTVLLSLEDKAIKDKFPAHWIILEEPIEDIHSLIFFSRLVISSGDSMAREGAMLGVSSIYCGIREMRANKLLIEKGLLSHYPSREALAPINASLAKPVTQNDQLKVREELLSQWDDMNVFIENQIDKFKKS
jgi:uncharacterized protein